MGESDGVPTMDHPSRKILGTVLSVQRPVESETVPETPADFGGTDFIICCVLGSLCEDVRDGQE